MALGATTTGVVRQFVAEHMTVIGIGGLLGWLAALLVAAGVLAGRPVDVAVFAEVPMVLLLVAVIACWLPAWRATKMPPMALLSVASCDR
jgi:ABC-type antimicrobial peptide transport system permease subunit